MGPEGKPLPFQTDEEVLDFLRSAKILSSTRIPVGVTEPKRLVLEKDGIRAHAVFRYVDIMKDRVHLADGTFVMRLRDSYLNEVAAYRLARLLGVDNVPPAIRRAFGREGNGSIQIWIEKSSLAIEGREQEGWLKSPREQRRLHDMHVFDNLINNIDRNLTNILVTEDRDLWLIDHTRSFARDKRLPKPHRIQMISRRLWQRLQTVSDDEIKACLKPFMGSFEIKALQQRRGRILELIENLIADKGEAGVLFSYKELSAEVQPVEVPPGVPAQDP
jgi:hypothetical protein